MQIEQVNGNHFHDQEIYHNEIIQSPFLSQSNSLELKSVKKAKFQLTQKILSSIDIPPLQFTPYISILPQKINSSQNNNNLTDNELISFKRDTIIYLNHSGLNCDKEVISGEKIICEEEKKNGVIAILIETKSDNDISKFKEEILLNCGEDYFVNEDSIVYERGTDCILGHEDEVKDNEKDDERFKLNHNVDESLIISIRKCFNCSSPYHSFNSCQLPLNKELIKINREKFNNEQDNKSNNGNGQQQFNSRYYIEYEKDFIFNIFLPGVISDVLKDALGILESGEEPPYYKRMRAYGYPPGYWGDNEGDDPLKPKKDRLSKSEEEQWNSATLKIYDNNESESDDSSEESGINNDSTDNDSENSESFDSKNRKNYSGTEENLTKNIIDPCTESQKETFEKKAQEIQKPQQEKKKKIPLVYYPGLNLDFAKFEKMTNKTTSNTNLNNNEANYNHYGQQFALYSTNTDQYYRTMSNWCYNRYSENVNIENGWYNYPPPGTTNSLGTHPSPWIITSGLEVQPPPPGTFTFTTSFVPPHEITPSNIEAVFNHSQNLSIDDKSHKDTSIQSTTNSLSDHQIMKNENHNNNIEVSNVEDCLEEDNDMDLSD